jgi:glycosyltransferase involved in cell wall biosynthesis
LADSNPELELPEVASLTVYTGRLEPNCGLETLIDAWTPITQHWPNARLWLVGEGSLRPALQQRIDEANLRHRAVLVGMFDQVDGVLAAADLVVRPGPEAGTAMAILEALAAGVPTIASDIPGHRTWITDGHDGLLVPPHDASAWAAAIRRMLDDPTFSTQLGGTARRKVANFSLANMADAHQSLFESLLVSREKAF